MENDPYNPSPPPYKRNIFFYENQKRRKIQSHIENSNASTHKATNSHQFNLGMMCGFRVSTRKIVFFHRFFVHRLAIILALAMIKNRVLLWLINLWVNFGPPPQPPQQKKQNKCTLKIDFVCLCSIGVFGRSVQYR